MDACDPISPFDTIYFGVAIIRDADGELKYVPKYSKTYLSAALKGLSPGHVSLGLTFSSDYPTKTPIVGKFKPVQQPSKAEKSQFVDYFDEDVEFKRCSCCKVSIDYVSSRKDKGCIYCKEFHLYPDLFSREIMNDPEFDGDLFCYLQYLGDKERNPECKTKSYANWKQWFDNYLEYDSWD
jgi:hypothetical protein